MKAFVIHAEKLKERAEHIDHMLSEEGIEYEFVNEGNDDEKIQGYLDKYMKDGRELLHRKVPRSLCTISHLERWCSKTISCYTSISYLAIRRVSVSIPRNIQKGLC